MYYKNKSKNLAKTIFYIAISFSSDEKSVLYKLVNKKEKRFISEIYRQLFEYFQHIESPILNIKWAIWKTTHAFTQSEKTNVESYTEVFLITIYAQDKGTLKPYLCTPRLNLAEISGNDEEIQKYISKQ